jgi:hypothetical protein
MLFTFTLRRNPSRLLGGVKSAFGHFFGGECEVRGLPEEARFVHILSLNLRDPALAFLRERFPEFDVLPFVMDTAEGEIAYSLNRNRFLLHSHALSDAEPLMAGPLPRQDASVVPFSYEQYRAVSLASAVFDDSYLRVEDLEALRSLGEEYSQIGGAHRSDNGAAPYCQNPECLGYPNCVMDHLASLQTQLAPGVSLDYCPNDPALHFYICTQCSSLSGGVAL